MRINPTLFLNKLTYIPDSGHFVWKTTGKLAGSINKFGYRELCVGTRQQRLRCYAHQLAWYILHGEWPDQIDHINGVKWDNRPHNLRNTSQQINNQNILKPKSHNKLNILGVTYSKLRNKYYANISFNGKKKYLGTYDNPNDAHQAYLNFKRKHHAGCTI